MAVTVFEKNKLLVSFASVGLKQMRPTLAIDRHGDLFLNLHNSVLVFRGSFDIFISDQK